MRSNPYQQETLRNGAFHYLLGRGAAGAAGFLTVLLLVRFMDLHNYATYVALSGLAALCGVLAGLGMERVVARYVPEARLYRSVEELSHFIWLTSAFRLLAAMLIMALLYVLWSSGDTFIAITKFEFFPVGLAFFIVAETMFQHFSSVLQSLIMQKALTRLLFIQWAGRLALILVVVFVNGRIDWQDSLWIFAIPELIGVIGFVVVILLQLKRLATEQHEVTNGTWPQWGKVAEISLHNFGFTLLAAPPQGYFMKVIAAAYLPEEIVAAYGFFLNIAEKARQYIPLHFFYGMLEPIIVASYLKDRDFSALSYRCQLLYKSNLLVMIPAIAWVAAAGEPIIEVITGSKFQGLSWILVLVMVQLTVGSHVVVLQLLLNSLEKSKVLVTASVVALLTMLVAFATFLITNPLLLLLTPILFSLTMNFYVVYQLACSSHSYKLSWKMMGSISLSGFVAFAAVEIFRLTAPWNLSASFTVVTTFFAISTIYIFTTWLTKTISKSEVDLIKKMMTANRPTKVEA